MIRAESVEGQVVVWIGDNELPLQTAEARDLASFLREGAVDRIWASFVGVTVGALRFQRADETDDQQHRRDLKRHRVIVSCEGGRWHLLPSELVELGDALHAQLDD